MQSTKKAPVSNGQRFTFGSLYQWVLVSFIIVIIPLVIVIIDSVIEVANYNQKSQQTLFRTVEATESSRIILERLISMERSIRQFQVLNEAELLSTYKNQRLKFLDTSGALATRLLDASLTEKLSALIVSEDQLHQFILNKLNDNRQKLTGVNLDAFDQLTLQARELLVEGENRLGVEAHTLSSIAQGVQQRLVYSALASIPLALILGLILVNLLTRPIKDIGQAIDKIGDVGFTQTIRINGPRDLIEIGQHLEQLRQKLNRLEYDKQQFIRNVSHELKTPLATLKEGTDLLAEKVVGEINAEQQEIIQVMKLGNITLHDLVENLLEYQRTISTQVELNLSVFDLKKLIDRVINEYQLPLRSKNISLLIILNSVNIKADYDKLKIIISNLFSNALKFSPQNGTMAITLTTEDPLIQIIVEDQGPGIVKQIQHLIYDDFYQGNSPQAWKIKGSGLGLALVNYYLKEHQGSIKLLSATEKFCGARFLIQLPQSE